MAHTVDTHDAYLIGDFIDHAVITDADAPVVLAANQMGMMTETGLPLRVTISGSGNVAFMIGKLAHSCIRVKPAASPVVFS